MGGGQNAIMMVKKERGGRPVVGGAQVRLSCFSNENYPPSYLARKMGGGQEIIKDYKSKLGDIP
jgi:hypothetical protein